MARCSWGVFQEGKGKVIQDGMRKPEERKDVGNRSWVLLVSYFCLGIMALFSYFTVSPL